MEGKKGERNRNKITKEWMVIISYVDRNHITVMFEDGTKTNTTYNRFLEGNVKKKPIPESIDDTEETVPGDEERELILKNKTGNIAEERKKTELDALALLNTYGKCVIIRSCGFGKTVIALKIMAKSQYNKCLFLHPQNDDINAEKIKKSQIGHKITSKTYAWLIGLSDEDIAKLNYDFVFLDECHLLGGDEFGTGAVERYKAVKKLMEWHKNTHFLGATATAIRMDGINVVDKLFDGIYCYPYTDVDAFEDGILKVPYYSYCVYDVVKKIRDKINKESKRVNLTLNKDQVTDLIEGVNMSMLEEIDERYMDEHIRTHCNNILKDTSYMRFIVYYLTQNDIDDNLDKVEGWFYSAFPEHEIVSTIVTSRSDKDLKYVDNLPTEPSDPKYKGRIDLIFNCKMLCMGYHSEKITGLVMDRKTRSYSLYQQMMGRLLSCDNDNPVIIFDIADNLHSDFITNMQEAPKIEVGEAPIEIKEPQTYQEYVKAYPNAINWVKVNKRIEAAKRTEEALSEVNDEEPIDIIPAINDDTGEVLETEDISVSEVLPPIKLAPIAESDPKDVDVHTDNSKPEKSERTIANAFTRALDKVKEKIAKDNLSFSEGIKLFEKVEDDFGELSSDMMMEDSEPTSSSYIPSANGPYASTPTLKTSKPEAKAPSEPAPRTKEEKKREELGYGDHASYYYNLSDGNMYGKNMKLLCKIADEEQIIDNLIKRPVKAVMDKIIAEYNNTNPDCTNYSSYEEVDKKEPRYKMLSRFCQMNGCPVEYVIRYMVEGKVA